MTDRLARGLFKTLAVLREYLPEIVVGGGWAPFLYHLYLFQGCKRELIFTRDIDLMVRPKVPVIGQKTIDRVLFDILTGCGGLKASIIKDLDKLSEKYPGWFRRFVKNIDADFTGPDSDAVLGVAGQRPPDAFDGLDDDQFRNFAFGTFMETKETLIPFVRAS